MLDPCPQLWYFQEHQGKQDHIEQRLKFHPYQEETRAYVTHTKQRWSHHVVAWRASRPVHSGNQLSNLASPVIRILAQFRQPTVQSSLLGRGLAPTMWPGSFPLISQPLQPPLALSTEVGSAPPVLGIAWTLHQSVASVLGDVLGWGWGLNLGSAPLDSWLRFDLRLNLVAFTGSGIQNWSKLAGYLTCLVGE